MPGQKNEHDGCGGLDALMAALTDEPLPEEAREDAAFLAEHRAATADIALLREQLGVLADVLTETAEETVVPLRRPRRPLLPLALKTVGVAAAGAMVVGMGWLVVQAGGGADDTGASSSAADKAESGASQVSGSPLGDPGYLACLRLVVEGDVTSVAPVAGNGRERVTLRVTRSYKPAKGPATVDFVMGEDLDPLLSKGDHVLVALPEGSGGPDLLTVGEVDIAPERTALARALPRAENLGCE
ncbi:hypothetical protein ACWD25_23670 [Streptomyces sp. NPDC002920]